MPKSVLRYVVDKVKLFVPIWGPIMEYLRNWWHKCSGEQPEVFNLTSSTGLLLIKMNIFLHKQDLNRGPLEPKASVLPTNYDDPWMAF